MVSGKLHSLDSGENRPAFSFLSFAQIESKELKELDILLEDAEKKKEIADSKEDKSYEDMMNIEKYDFVKEAKERWSSFLIKYQELNDLMDKSKLSKINHWFLLNDDKSNQRGDEYLSEMHWGGIIPKDLDELKKKYNSSY